MENEAVTPAESGRDLKTGLEHYYKSFRNSMKTGSHNNLIGPKQKNMTLDSSKLRSLQNATEGKKEAELINNSNTLPDNKLSMVKHRSKKVVYNEKELVQELYGIEHIMYFFAHYIY